MDVPVVDVEGPIGLKLQAIVNDPRRRLQGEADIVALLRLHLPDPAVRSLDEFIEFLEAVEAVTGPHERPRPPTREHRFLL